ncbi:hypothetical protein BC827DRAFT_1192957 [Russula dissimulans]|nr:hypothetical protein BC827DRAFT_1192957 [Russula dissimulans]
MHSEPLIPKMGPQYQGNNFRVEDVSRAQRNRGGNRGLCPSSLSLVDQGCLQNILECEANKWHVSCIQTASCTALLLVAAPYLHTRGATSHDPFSHHHLTRRSSLIGMYPSPIPEPSSHSVGAQNNRASVELTRPYEGRSRRISCSCSKSVEYYPRRHPWMEAQRRMRAHHCIRRRSMKFLINKKTCRPHPLDPNTPPTSEPSVSTSRPLSSSELTTAPKATTTDMLALPAVRHFAWENVWISCCLRQEAERTDASSARM